MFAAISMTAVLAATGVVLSAAPARADFHPACDNASALAFTDLQETFSGLQYRGYVDCDGAAIDAAVTLSAVGKGIVAETSASCAPSTNPCVAADTVAPAPGHYKVEMTYTTTGNDHTYTAYRVTEWVYLGAGQPRQTCPLFGFPPPFSACI
jgi:hypothetical protein